MKSNDKSNDCVKDKKECFFAVFGSEEENKTIGIFCLQMLRAMNIQLFCVRQMGELMELKSHRYACMKYRKICVFF